MYARGMDLARFRPWFGNNDSVRFCGLRLEAIERALTDSKIVDALVDQLEVPGKASVLKALTHDQKLAAIEEQIDSFRTKSTSVWFEVKPAEVLAASIWRAQKLGPKILDVIFSAVRREADLYEPVATWLKGQELQTFAEVPMGRCRCDVVGYREGNWLRSESIVAVELKAADEQMKRGLDQMATYRAYAHRVYMACTPAEIAEYLDLHAEARGVKHWDGEALYRKLRDHGYGLLVVEGARAFEFLTPTSGEIDSKKLDEVRTAMARMR